MHDSSPAHIYRQAVACYTGDGIERLKRNWRYLRLPDNTAALYGSFEAVASVGVGGAFLCGGFGKELAQAFPLGPRGKMTLIGMAMGGGFTVGLGLGIYGQMYIVEKSAGFKEWREFQITKALKALVKERFAHDPVWKALTCAITKSPMFIPVRTPSGHLCDYEKAEELADSVTGLIHHFRLGSPLHKDDLKTDREASLVILKRLKYLMEQDIAACVNDPDIYQLLCKEKEMIEQAIKIQYEKARARIEKRRREEVVTEDVYDQELAAFKQLFGRGAKHELQWTHNWPQVLDRRWKRFHPAEM